jgi:transcriptional regulator with XRE-family HTH domain
MSKDESKPALDPEVAEKILDADFQNIVKKVAAGKPLTVAERTRIESRAAGSTESTAYAKTKVELAELLGVSRRTLSAWQRRKGAPKPLSNGMWAVADWREFVRINGLKGSTKPVVNEEALKARKLLAEVEERELRIAIKKGEYVPLDKVREEWIGFVAQATSVLRAKFENELPPVLSGLDATGIQRECRRAIDEVLRCLHQS